MSWGYGNYGRHETVAAKKAKAARQLARLRAANPQIAPIVLQGKAIARSWWARAWCTNLESYADYENRIERGRSYLRNGQVLDLVIEEGLVTALVMGSGSSLYTVTVQIDGLPQKQWQAIVENCGRHIDSLADLVSGSFPEAFGERFLDQHDGLFPAPAEIHFSCSCPDWASMCKHVAAVLYGIGARLDDDPLLFFKLRGIPHEDLLRASVESSAKLLLANANNVTARVLSDIDIDSVFGL